MDIPKLAKEFYHDIEEHNAYGLYCIIMYCVSDFRCKQVYKIYGSIPDFEAKAPADVKALDPMYGVDFQLWVFD